MSKPRKKRRQRRSVLTMLIDGERMKKDLKLFASVMRQRRDEEEHEHHLRFQIDQPISESDLAASVVA